jgi:hypothetical protein
MEARPLTPWQTACEIPSDIGLGSDVCAHLCVPGAYVLSTPRFLLLAREVDIHGSLDDLLNPYARFHVEQCNAWSLDLVAGDACAAYECLVATAGDREFVCWKSKRGLHCRKSGASFIRFLQTISRSKQNVEGLRKQ